jgi:transcriptional regulator with XRE-family HTH domain
MDLGLTMKNIAEKTGVSETRIYNWEIRNRKPYRRTEEKLKTILGLNKEIPV